MLMVKSLQDKYNDAKTQLSEAKADVDQERERSMATMAELAKERQRSAAREQEALESRTQLSTLQQELATAIEKIKIAEQERDAFKDAAKSEEAARIAAEGRISLPTTKNASAPLLEVEAVSSEASEEEIEQLREELAAARYHVDTAYDLIAYMDLECRFNCCSCRSGTKSSINLAAESGPIATRPVNVARIPSPESDIDMMEDVEMGGVEDDAMEVDTKEPSTLRTSTIFVPAEGIFRTVPSRSQQQPSQQQQPQPSKSYRTSGEQMPPPSLFNNNNNREPASSRQPTNSTLHNRQARTPSVEPPTFANNVMLPTDASILSFAGSAPSSAVPSPATNPPNLFNRQENQRPAESGNAMREQQDEFRKEVHQQPAENVNSIFQHHLHQQSDPVHPADLAAGRFRHHIHGNGDKVRAEYGEKDQGVGEQPKEGRQAYQPYVYEQSQLKPVRRIGENPVFASQSFTQRVQSQDEPVRQGDNPVFGHHLHTRDEPVRREDRSMRPPAPPAKRSHNRGDENERPKDHLREPHHANHYSSHHRPEHNFRTISTTTKIFLRSDDDDEPKSASAIHHSSSSTGFGMDRVNSSLSEPAIITRTLSEKSVNSDLPVSREEALAMIRERRGRARSMHQDDKKDGSGRDKSRPPTMQEAPKTPKRDISVGTVKSTSQRNARSVSRGRLHGQR